MVPPPRLILFDIDGTLLSTGGRAGQALLQALVETYGVAPRVNGYSFAGKTDLQIVRELVTGAGISPPLMRRRRSRALRLYLRYLEEALVPGSVRVLPGVEGLLAALWRHPGVTLGLLTGNVAAGADLKLRAAGLRGYFACGAFGSDHEDRNRLVPIARARARAATGLDFPPHRTVVVGDAEADVLCARAGGARAVAVASGGTSFAALAALAPDVVLHSLAQPGALEALLAAGEAPAGPQSSTL